MRNPERFHAVSTSSDEVVRKQRRSLCAAASIGGEFVRQREIFLAHIVGPDPRKLQFHVDASAARQSPSRSETKVRTPSTIDGERGRVGGRGQDHRHPRPQCYNPVSSDLRRSVATTRLGPSIAFPTASTASAWIDAIRDGQVRIRGISDVKHCHGKLHFQVDASATPRRRSRSENRFSASTPIDDEPLGLGQRGLDRRHPRPHRYNLV